MNEDLTCVLKHSKSPIDNTQEIIEAIVTHVCEGDDQVCEGDKEVCECDCQVRENCRHLCEDLRNNFVRTMRGLATEGLLYSTLRSLSLALRAIYAKLCDQFRRDMGKGMVRRGDGKADW